MVLKQGDRGPQVQELQVLLNHYRTHRGIPELVADGIYGQGTKNAVIDVQTAFSLVPDGVAGELTFAALRACETCSEDDGSPFTKSWIIADKTQVEAGYVNNPDDSGGETNHGITVAVAGRHKSVLTSKFGWNGNMRDLTVEMAYYIYDQDYWQLMALDQIRELDPKLADKMFDMGINLGTYRVNEWLRHCLNAFSRKYTRFSELPYSQKRPDAACINAIRVLYAKEADMSKKLISALFCMQGFHYLDISVKYTKNQSFTHGWMGNRLVHNADQYFG